jgi:hypothetical protein
MQMFGKFAEEYGPEAVEKGIELAIRRSGREKPEFLPSPEDFELAIRKAKYSPQLKSADPKCSKCDGTGWMYTPAGRVTVCDCRKLSWGSNQEVE